MTRRSARFDLIVVGTGAGGSAPARKCAAAGWKVAVVDDQPYGGTCALRGCDPKKVLVSAAEVLAWQQRMVGFGLTGTAAINWPALQRFKQTFVESVPGNREASFRDAGIAAYHGSARFTGPGRLVVADSVLEAERFVIASGAKPRPLGIGGEEHLTNSTQFLELESLPRRVVFVGAGYIGFEFAHVARYAGGDVTMVGRGEVLPDFEPDHVTALVAHTRAIGVDVRLDSSVTAIDSSGTALRVHYVREGQAAFVDADVAVHSGGRVPATDELDLPAAGIASDEHGAVRVNEYLQSVSNARVYAAGDAALPPGSLPLTPVAAHEAHVVAANLLNGNTKKADYGGAASIVFAVPPLARAGITEAAARAAGLEVKVRAGDTSGWQSSRRVRAEAGAFKTIADKQTGRLLGAHIFGHNADETINLFALAIRQGLAARDVRHALLGYPTSASDAVYMV